MRRIHPIEDQLYKDYDYLNVKQVAFIGIGYPKQWMCKKKFTLSSQD